MVNIFVYLNLWYYKCSCFQLVSLGRDAGGQKNLAKKTLVDERFLI